MRISEKLKLDAKDIWEKIYTHPFVIELFEGKLPIKKFKYYVVQDYNFLLGMTKATSILASRAWNYELLKEALTLAYNDVIIEMNSYTKLLHRLGLTLETVLKTEPAPTNIAYVNHVLVTCSLGSLMECLASILPCFWTYMEIPKIHKELIKHNTNEIYREWIKTYTSREYILLTTNLIRLFDKYSKEEEYERLKKAFITSSKYEWMFWDMSYKMEKWPVP